MSHPYDKHWDTPEFIVAWKESLSVTDGCTSGPLQSIASWFVDRTYMCCCVDHDFDWKVGWKFGMTQYQADQDLKECVKAAGYKYTAIAIGMYIAVRTVGSVLFWNGPSGYKENDKKLLGD